MWRSELQPVENPNGTVVVEDWVDAMTKPNVCRWCSGAGSSDLLKYLKSLESVVPENLGH
jgi:hypothetical protein